MGLILKKGIVIGNYYGNVANTDWEVVFSTDPNYEKYNKFGETEEFLDDTDLRMAYLGYTRYRFRDLDILRDMDKVQEAMESTKELNPKHHATLLGERPSGSQWGVEMSEKALIHFPWREVPSDSQEGMLPFCTYFRVDLGEGTSCTQVCEPSNEVNSSSISVSEGEHGLELVSTEIRPRACTEAWLIVGPAEDADGNAIEGETMVWTAYPGELMPPLPQEWDGDIESLDLSLGYAVKRG